MAMCRGIEEVNMEVGPRRVKRMSALSSISRIRLQPRIQGAYSIQAMNGSRPDQRRSHRRTKCPPYHEALATRSMVDGEVLEASSRLAPNRPSSQARKPTHPSKRPGPNRLSSNGKATLEILRPEVGFFGSDARTFTQIVDLALDGASRYMFLLVSISHYRWLASFFLGPHSADNLEFGDCIVDGRERYPN
ncbi:hypothetical protein O181_041370 [Austropuccinia psidii MF-1]|uniref:Uncharacterized protein n=1 Tax=Austropuccinia psidii MF-1 TaxID=1389203 RepID=A0A9Q3HH31_9BASI|nr:hypothetical protein [Austropuccinia psidii MF-1]